MYREQEKEGELANKIFQEIKKKKLTVAVGCAICKIECTLCCEFVNS